ncbi:AraC family transcriptional regulator [Paenibacillus filicis]|uniref:AraC family transcriptional regulator n=1 Tax=Paenibacillus gyeongsangnamensis TaxID=3388067 RepID=A0ABT4QBC3_9BACL|nr:AraC family transcriptional regulator [Paenibacillus filicis]MCZ8514166.1 AraC family transcriptional regulator [Paenibacillus filicis]
MPSSADQPKRTFLLEHTIRSGPFNMNTNHAHDSYEIYYMKAGARYYFIKDRSYLVREGDLVLIEPMVLHRTTEAYSSHHERVLFNFKKASIHSFLEDMPDDLLSAFRDNPIIRPEAKEKAWADAHIGRMLAEQEHGGPGSAGLLKLLLTELLLWIYRQGKLPGGRGALPGTEHPTTLHRKVSEIVQFINDHYEKELTLHTVANRFHISSYYLCRIFKEATGFTLVEYIQRLRVREAQRLLSATRLQMSEVAGRVGFDSGTHFGRVFKSICGVSPLQYRKAAAAEEPARI